MKKFITVADAPNMNELVSKALAYKQDPFSDNQLGKNKRIGLLFLNPSMRTRLSTQIAAQNLISHLKGLNDILHTNTITVRSELIIRESSIKKPVTKQKS